MYFIILFNITPNSEISCFTPPDCTPPTRIIDQLFTLQCYITGQVHIHIKDRTIYGSRDTLVEDIFHRLCVN